MAIFVVVNMVSVNKLCKKLFTSLNLVASPVLSHIKIRLKLSAVTANQAGLLYMTNWHDGH